MLETRALGPSMGRTDRVTPNRIAKIRVTMIMASTCCVFKSSKNLIGQSLVFGLCFGFL
jgi:hypothetical protein